MRCFIVHFTAAVQDRRNRWWPKPFSSIVRVYTVQPEHLEYSFWALGVWTTEVKCTIHCENIRIGNYYLVLP